MEEVRTASEAIDSLNGAKPLSSLVSPWLAVSLLQKAIRRGDAQWAVRAVYHLTYIDPDRLWRRLLIVAFEDIGMGDLELVCLTCAAHKHRRFYEKQSQSLAICAYLAWRMAKAVKCRATDDLHVVIERQPSAIEDLQFACMATLPELLVKVFGEGYNDQSDESGDLLTHAMAGQSDAPNPTAHELGIAERGLALWAALGVKRTTHTHGGYRTTTLRRGSPKAVFDAMIDHGWCLTLVEAARYGFAKTGEHICAFLPLLYEASKSAAEARELKRLSSHQGTSQATLKGTSAPIHTTLPEPALMPQHGVPIYAADFFTREGRSSLRRFKDMPSNTMQIMRTHIPSEHHIDALGQLLFRVQASQVDQRLNNQLALELKWRAEELTTLPYGEDRLDIYDAFTRDLPLLHRLISEKR